MGMIEICESGSADCYVENSGELLLTASNAFGCTALARCSCACLRSRAWQVSCKTN